MRYRKREGTAVVLDLASSSKLHARMEDDLALEFFNTVLWKYSLDIAKIARPFIETNDDSYVRPTGDGLVALCGDVARGVRLAIRLQDCCDHHHGFFWNWINSRQSRSRHGSRKYLDRFDYSTGIGVSTSRYYKQGKVEEPEMDEYNILGRFTGPIFVKANRIASKARPYRAVLSPLFDKKTVDTVAMRELFFFKIGTYYVDRKNVFETIVKDEPTTLGENYRNVEVYSVVRGEPLLMDFAEGFARAVDLYYRRQFGAALRKAESVARYVDAHSSEIRDHTSQINLLRWQHAVEHLTLKIRSVPLRF